MIVPYRTESQWILTHSVILSFSDIICLRNVVRDKVGCFLSNCGDLSSVPRTHVKLYKECSGGDRDWRSVAYYPPACLENGDLQFQ